MAEGTRSPEHNYVVWGCYETVRAEKNTTIEVGITMTTGDTGRSGK